MNMDNFCTSEFWNSNLTWNTDIPLFTSCFLKTVAIWTPIVFFWIFIPVEALYLSRSKDLKLPWTFLSIAKLVITFILISTAITEIVFYVLHYQSGAKVHSVQYYTPFLILVTLIAVFIVILFHRKKGIVTSGVLFLFWLLFTVATGLAFYTVLQRVFNNAVPYDAVISKFEFVVTVIYFPLAFTQLVFHFFPDQRCRSNEIDPKENPEARASFLSNITFWWFNTMAILGYKQPLKIEDMWELKPECKSINLQERFNKYWIPLLTACFGQVKRVKALIARTYSKQYSVEAEVKIEPDKSEDLLTKLSVLKPIMKTFWPSLISAGVLKFIASCITFLNPMILDALIAFVSSDEPYWKGYVYAGSMFFVAMLESFFNSQYEMRIYTIAMQIRSCVTATVYKKALALSTSAKKNFTTGEIVNLMSVDIQRVMDYVQVVNLLWSAPLQIGIALYLLWQQLGFATFGGVSIMILMIPFNAVISIFIRNVQVRLMKDKDKRTKLLNEILGGIKVLKLYAWEPSFESKIMDFRMDEVKSLISQAYLSGAITFAFASAPFLVALASFATFVLISTDNVLDANKAFVSLSLFNILRIPTALLPMIITYTAMFLVSLKRINKYLQSDELDPNVIGHDAHEEDPIIIEDGIFSWSKDEAPALTDINLRVKSGSLVAVVGQVGSGKSSLLSSLLGELEKFNGRVNVNGSIAYVPQQAWIQNATLRKNVLFIKSYDERKFNSVIEACALKPDLEILPGGDQTEIGEKGINLSGGQKQRISLARAVYDDADIYFLDDPLSAVDAHVGKHIFEKVIGPNGMLKKKTRILATHRISVLPEVDCIVVLKDGKITETGSYNELLNKKGAFAEFLIQYLENNVADEEILNEDLNFIEEIVEAVRAPAELRRQISHLSDPASETDSDFISPKRSASIITASNGIRRRSKSEKTDSFEKLSKSSRQSSKAAAGTNLTEKEVAEVGSVKWWVYFEYMKAFGYWGFTLTFFGFMASTAFSLGTNLWLTAWSNDALDPENVYNIPLRNRRLGVYGGLGAGEIFFTLVSSVSTNLACIRASRILHDAMLVHILRAPMSFFDTTPMGRILNRFSKDIDTADVTIRFNIRMFFLQAFRAVGAFIIISLETPIFLAAILPLGILYYFMQKIYIPTSRQLKRLESVTRSPIYVHFSETVTGSTSIRAYGADTQFIEQNYNLVDINNSSYYPSLAASRWLSIRLEFIGYIIVFLSALFAVLLRETLSPGIAGLSVSYALQITGILNMLVRSTADVETNIVAVERCLDYTKTPTEASWTNEEKKPKPDWPDSGVINFNKYSTRYREGLDLVLKNISCSINSKERVGIVGRTGAGKSSLTVSLFRIIESASGSIIIDNLNIADMGLHDLRKKLTIIPQDPVLFTGTLRMNLDPFDQHSDPEIWVALELAHLKTFIASLEKGLQHEIAEGGENLSVGQRQLVCLARALLRKTKVLILDEATAAVDVETDEVIQTTIRTAFSESTVLTIAHRLNTVLDYDRVMVLSQGEIAELDSPKVLLQNEKSMFYSMAKDAGLV